MIRLYNFIYQKLLGRFTPLYMMQDYFLLLCHACVSCRLQSSVPSALCECSDPRAQGVLSQGDQGPTAAAAVLQQRKLLFVGLGVPPSPQCSASFSCSPAWHTDSCKAASC